MIAQNTLPIHYNFEKTISGLTGFAGLPLYMEMASVSGLTAAIKSALATKSQGWHDEQIILSLILLNIAGGECVDDIERLNSDDGLSVLLSKLETFGMKRKARRTHERRWRKNKSRAFPSDSAVHRYLEQFHNDSEEAVRVEGRAFIPAQNTALQALNSIHSSLIHFAQQRDPAESATLDQDATLVETNKRSALYCYKKFKAYQPFNTYWAEQGLLLHTEFRDGNVPAGFEQLRLLKASLKRLPDGIKHVYLRSDSAGYQQNVLRYCANGENRHVGVIEFAISAKVSAGFKAAVKELPESAWQPITKKLGNGECYDTAQEYAEVCFIPSWLCIDKGEPHLRFIAIREALHAQQELELTGEDESHAQTHLPFPTIQLSSTQYKLFGVVTNRHTMSGNALIAWHRERCGDSEQVHSIQKGDLAGGQLPSDKFGANAAWWSIMCLAFNLQTLMKNLALPTPLKSKRLKGLRFHLISLPGRVIRHARQLSIKLNGSFTMIKQVKHIRARLSELAQPPPAIAMTA